VVSCVNFSIVGKYHAIMHQYVVDHNSHKAQKIDVTFCSLDTGSGND